MRRMSFSATVEQMRDGTKTVTRRDPSTWRNLQPGDRLLAIEKAMGLPAGAKQVPIGVIEVVSNTVERLVDMADGDVAREGFPGKSFAWFVDEVWLKLHPDPSRKSIDEHVRRIEFVHIGTGKGTELDDERSGGSCRS